MLAYLDTLIGFAVIMLGASLILTILTQMASALFSHRGANLRWGLETMFRNVPNCPMLKAHARQVAEDVLTHHLISDSIFSGTKWLANRMKLATAVSPEELAAILKDLASKETYKTLVQPATGADCPAISLSAEIMAVLATPNPAAIRRIQLLTGAPTLEAVKAEMAPWVTGTVNSMRDAAGELEAWFGATMDRVATRFTLYARLWTIGFACAFAAITGMNSVTVLSDLYSHGDFRQQMVGTAQQMIDVTKKVMPENAKSVGDAVQSAMTEMYTGAAVNALKDAAATANDKPVGVETEEQGKTWFTDHVADPAQRTAALAAFDKEIAAGSRALLEQRAKDGAEVRSILTNASFDVLQVHWKKDAPVWPELPGVLATAALLSMGAPFWFNLLKSLTNLRPVVANKQDPGSK
jgi:hypothetical protein